MRKSGEVNMRLSNCRVDEAQTVFGSRKIVFFGEGMWLQLVYGTELMKLHDNFAYVIDNNHSGDVVLGEKELATFRPEILLKEAGAVIVITSSMYMYEMYSQLLELELSDEFECFSFPLMQMISSKPMISHFDCSKDQKQRIPKVIHSFWFSEEEKSFSYQKCVSSWHNILDGYEIIEWNTKNYDCSKNKFVKRAIELKAWAFAADYARLDVLNTYGGIYLDMDVEVFKPFDPFLGNRAILSFANNVMIDLAVVASEKDNVLLDKLMRLYDEIDLPMTKQEFNRYIQPQFVRNVLIENGIIMNGSFQKTEYATVFPSEFFMPLDTLLFEMKRTDNSVCIHYDNAGWDANRKEIRQSNAKRLWEIVRSINTM